MKFNDLKKKIFKDKSNIETNDKHNHTLGKCRVDGTQLKYYDGALGYEAVYCPKCGYYEDHTTTGQDDSFKNE